MSPQEASLPPADSRHRIPIDPVCLPMISSRNLLITLQSQMTPEVAARKAQAEAVPCPTAHCDADRHAIANMHAQLVTMRYQGLGLKDKFTTQQAIHEAELAQLNGQLQMQRGQHVYATQGMRAHAMVQETRINGLTADKLQREQQDEQGRADVRAFKEVIKEKDKKIWKYTQQLGDKAADLEMVRADRDAARELVNELKNKANALERAKEVAERP